jgi:glycosyltransferase involved in cell wall biosynthesis
MIGQLQTLQISIVIPVYNEEQHLAACLEAISRQTVKPFEVLVVDNNSTDATVTVARSFPFVTVLSEKRQGVVYARDRGFNQARGDIIGRIDADTVISQNWVATIEQLFKAAPGKAQLGAVSGAVSYYDLPWQESIARLDLTFRQWIANGMGRDVFLYGSNMAVRRSAWLKTRKYMCRTGGLHEDFDLAIHLTADKSRVVFDRRLKAAVSLRRFHVTFNDYFKYVWLSPQTYHRHGRFALQRMYAIVALVLSCYLIIKLVYRAYDPLTDKVSLNTLLTPRDGWRVNPATFVD